MVGGASPCDLAPHSGTATILHRRRDVIKNKTQIESGVTLSLDIRCPSLPQIEQRLASDDITKLTHPEKKVCTDVQRDTRFTFLCQSSASCCGSQQCCDSQQCYRWLLRCPMVKGLRLVS